VTTKDDRASNGITRRQAIAATLGGAVAVAAGIESAGCSAPEVSTSRGGAQRPSSKRMPVAFVPHGGGPWPFVDLGFGDRRETDALASYLRELPALTPASPRALLVVSAHWEEPVPTVMTSDRPPMLYDYYGFPPESYQITWPAPGDSNLAARIQELLRSAGIASASNAERGFDHGTFVPLKLAYPAAEVPAVQLSLKRGLDPAEHIAIGKALAPLRDEGVFIVGSGMSYHNMRGFGGAGRAASESFDTWLREAATAAPADRDRLLSVWSTAPSAREAHPREEHLLPLMVIAGAAEHDQGRTAFNDTFANVRLSGFHYG
jgi:aromatic ring-opening dioxygenase catalytic subunit (LigB family)